MPRSPTARPSRFCSRRIGIAQNRRSRTAWRFRRPFHLRHRQTGAMEQAHRRDQGRPGPQGWRFSETLHRQSEIRALWGRGNRNHEGARRLRLPQAEDRRSDQHRPGFRVRGHRKRRGRLCRAVATSWRERRNALDRPGQSLCADRARGLWPSPSPASSSARSRPACPSWSSRSATPSGHRRPAARSRRRFARLALAGVLGRRLAASQPGPAVGGRRSASPAPSANSAWR